MEGFREALRALVMSESIVGARVVDYQQYLSDLQNTLAGSALHIHGIEREGYQMLVVIQEKYQENSIYYWLNALPLLSNADNMDFTKRRLNLKLGS